jgi:hypothetical protein
MWLHKGFYIGVLFYFKQFSNDKTFLVPQYLLKIHNCTQPYFVRYIRVRYNESLLCVCVCTLLTKASFSVHVWVESTDRFFIRLEGFSLNCVLSLLWEWNLLDWGAAPRRIILQGTSHENNKYRNGVRNKTRRLEYSIHHTGQSVGTFQQR